MRRPSKYPEDLRERPVRMVAEFVGSTGRSGLRSARWPASSGSVHRRPDCPRAALAGGVHPWPTLSTRGRPRIVGGPT